MFLKFNGTDLVPLVAHAKSCKKWNMGYASEKKGQPALLLIKDSGIYFMSNGYPILKREEGKTGSKVVYAEGYPQGTHVRGDDWVEIFPISEIEAILACATIQVKISKDDMEIIGK